MEKADIEALIDNVISDNTDKESFETLIKIGSDDWLRKGLEMFRRQQKEIQTVLELAKTFEASANLTDEMMNYAKNHQYFIDTVTAEMKRRDLPIGH